MKTSSLSICAALLFVGSSAAAQDAPTGDWIRALPARDQRATFHDDFQNVRGDRGKWSDEPQFIHAPPSRHRPPKTALDDWLDQLLETNAEPTTPADDNWLLFRTRQLDDNDRVWIERIERNGNRFTITLNEAIWQGKYFKTFTYYNTYGVNLGKLPAGAYEATLVIRPLEFTQFEGDGRPQSNTAGRQVENGSKDERPVEKKPVELRTAFTVAPR